MKSVLLFYLYEFSMEGEGFCNLVEDLRVFNLKKKCLLLVFFAL